MTEEKHEEHAHSHEAHSHDAHAERHSHEAHSHDAHAERHSHEAHGGGGKPFSKKISENYGIVGGIALILLALAGVYFILGASGSDGTGGVSPTPASLALSVTRIRAPDCSDCFDVDPILQKLQANGAVLTVRVLDYSDSEAQSLVSKYGVVKLPTLLFSGFDSKRKSEVATLLSSYASEAADGNFVLNAQEAPYYDVLKKRVAGKVNFISLVSTNCTECFNVSLLVAQLGAPLPNGLGVSVSSERVVDYESAEGRKLVEAYNLSTVPSLIASSDLGEYPAVTALWPRVGTVETDGSFVMRAATPPFVNLTTGKVAGLVSVVYLKDSSCAECYDVKLHKQVLVNMGVFVSNETDVEVNSTLGKKLVKSYNVTLVPTILFSPEASVYGSLAQVWSKVGTVEEDGWFIFRNMGAIEGSVYKNIQTGEVIGLKASPSPSPAASALPTVSPKANQTNSSA